ncbi:TrmH family RNA methyltransferase [Dactylosporangium sp. CA-139066]|uniref:TrmH family RNA methyltransferase n=1 Tax=Dactylosporangium sp. CA-139066 TaxID=3239930 RepID=UPI003D8DC28D
MVRLVGDGVENPANAEALVAAAAMFGVAYGFRDERGLLAGVSKVGTEALLATPIVAVDNADGAESVYRRGSLHSAASIVVGNERKGIRPDLLRAAARTVCIPMPGRGVNTLNVATAAAVALYYLGGASGRRTVRGPRPESQRPGVLLAGPRDHVEAGSSLRSAAAFGWTSVGLDDRDKVWFGTPRPVRAEGRAAARSHRNPLRVVPGGGVQGYTRVIVCTEDADGPPVHRTDLTGAGTLLVVPDGDFDAPAGAQFARVGAAGAAGRYRFLTGIVLAEAARQLGPRPEGSAGRPPRRGLSYRSELGLDAAGDLVEPWELLEY